MCSTFLVLSKFRLTLLSIAYACLCMCLYDKREKYIFPNNIENKALWVKVYRTEWILAKPYI